MILINIEMPEDCLLCPFAQSDAESPFFEVYCRLLKRWVEEADVYERQEDCPLREARRGKWIDTGFLKLKECSCCHTPWVEYSAEDFDYCPTCGAKMDKE